MMPRKLGLGILLPLEKGPTGYFRQGFDPLTQVRSNLINLLNTAKGERIFNPSFGCDIHNLLFDNITDDLISEIDSAIQEAVSVWIPQLSVKLTSIEKMEDRNRIKLIISYSLKTNVANVNTITLVV